MDEHGWDEYAASRLSTPTMLLGGYGLLSLWMELLLLGQSARGASGLLEPLLRREFGTVIFSAAWSFAGVVVHLLGIGVAASALWAAASLRSRTSLRLARMTVLFATFGSVVLPIADLLSASCCALVPTLILGLFGLSGGMIGLAALQDEGVVQGFARA